MITCLFTINRTPPLFFAQAVGAAVLVHRFGTIELVVSVFKGNVAANGSTGIGIVNLGGDVQCDANCLPVCTSCKVDDDASHNYGNEGGELESAPFAVAFSFAIIFCIVGIAVRKCRPCEFVREFSMVVGAGPRQAGDENTVELSCWPLLTDVDREPDLSDLARSSPPAPIFALDRERRIRSWNPGESCIGGSSSTIALTRMFHYRYANDAGGGRYPGSGW